MKKDNVLMKVSQHISSTLNENAITSQLEAVLNDIDTIYSYLIYGKYSNKQLVGWKIDYAFSQIDKYNTLICKDLIAEIVETLEKSRYDTKYIIGYKQPDIELMLELYHPLIHKLVIEQCNRWSCLEYEDAYSMCQLTALRLYRKGYYIHKSLLRKSFNNDVLMSLRHRKNEHLVSLEQRIKVSANGDDNDVTLADMLPDKNLELQLEQEDTKEIIALIFAEVKDIIVDKIGERQFDQLFRDYGQKHTTSWSRKKMQDIKKLFSKLGITWKSFEKYL